MIPVSVIVVTKNESDNLAHCLLPLVTRFQRVIVLDSQSRDDTIQIAQNMGAEVMRYLWGGEYPKKRGWALENIYGLGEWVLFVDADEVLSPALVREIRLLFARGVYAEGFFIKGRPVWMRKALRFGLWNNKLCLFRTDCFAFPVVDDLDIAGMGEIEGHYQPVRINPLARIGQLQNPMLHENRKGRGAWIKKHKNYAQWEAEMIKRNAFPPDPIAWRESLKQLTRKSPLRPYLVFVYSYIFKLGFLDGLAGFDYALTRARYTHDVLKRMKNNNE